MAVSPPLQVGWVSTDLGDMTCNQAEYCALIVGLEVCTGADKQQVLHVSYNWENQHDNYTCYCAQAAFDAGVRDIQVTGDSNLVVKQVCKSLSWS